MKEIGFAVWDLLDGIELAEGSMILVGSVSDLDSQGVSGYSDELARTIRVLREKLGNHVQVVAMPPVLLGGVNSPRLVRNIIECEYWVERLEGGGEPPEEHEGSGDGQAGGARHGTRKEECGGSMRGAQGGGNKG